MAIAQIIKYEGDNSVFIWKHPIEDFNTTTQLIVHESQEAILFRDGQALDLFGSGRYTLETQNIPFLKRLINLPTGGETPFHCEVYFINKTEQMAIKWGTDSKVQFMEPTYQFPIQIGASGEMSLKADDSRKLLVKLVGTEKHLGQEGLVRLFRAFLMTRAKSYLAQTIREKKISIFEIDEHLNNISDDLHTRLMTDFASYGVALERFLVTTIVKPDGDPSYEKFKSLHFRKYADVAEAQLRQQVGVIDQQTEAQRKIIDAQALAQKRSIEGYTYQQERGFDVAEKVAQNEGAGNFSSAGIGLGMMTGIGGAVGNTVGGVFTGSMGPLTGAFTGAAVNPTNPGGPADPTSPSEPPTAPAGNPPAASNSFCDNCGTALAPEAVFCDECGTPVAKPEICANCGFVFEKPGKFCPKCGTKR